MSEKTSNGNPAVVHLSKQNFLWSSGIFLNFDNNIILQLFLCILKEGGGPIGRNSIVKNSENFSELNAKNFV